MYRRVWRNPNDNFFHKNTLWIWDESLQWSVLQGCCNPNQFWPSPTCTYFRGVVPRCDSFVGRGGGGVLSARSDHRDSKAQLCRHPCSLLPHRLQEEILFLLSPNSLCLRRGRKIDLRQKGASPLFYSAWTWISWDQNNASRYKCCLQLYHKLFPRTKQKP